MALDSFESLPGIIHELQDGGLQINEANTAPSTIVIGLASKGVTGIKSPVVRANEAENAFGKEGNLVRGMYEAIAGGAENVFLLRINAKSAILYGVGTDNQATNPTSIETLLKDGSAADAYLVRYTTPASLGPNATEGRLQVRNATGRLVYDNNPGGSLLDLGEVIVSGSFDAGSDIGALGDPEDFVSMRDLAQDAVQVTGEAVGAMAGAGPEQFDLANADTVAGSYVVYVDGAELVSSEFQINVGAGTGGVDQLEVDLSGNLTGGEAITIDYKYDAEPSYNLRDGSDGLNASKMQMYEALEEAYASLENDEVDVVIPQGVFLDDKNVVDGASVTLSSDESVDTGRRYPVAGSNGDALGKLYKEEFEGEVHYFWDIDGDGEAEIYPVGVGSASSTTKISGDALELADFKEVNFAYQLANFCFSLSVNDNECTGVIGTLGPKSYSAKDISQWIGKEPQLDADGKLIANGTGLLGNKFMAGTLNRDRGLFATFSGHLPIGADFDTNADIIRDRNGNKIDIGKYISVTAMPLTQFNNTDDSGFGYQANMAAYYGGFYSNLPSNSSPTNKVIAGVRAPFRVSKTKLNSLTKYHYIAIKQKEDTLRISDAPTAARDDSDFTRLTTVRIVADTVDAVRTVAEPYIGEPNTAAARVALETGITRELSRLQELGFLQRFEAKVTATVAQQIQGNATVELVLVPAFELKKITIITSLARQ
jgi:hypothetical protein